MTQNDPSRPSGTSRSKMECKWSRQVTTVLNWLTQRKKNKQSKKTRANPINRSHSKPASNCPRRGCTWDSSHNSHSSNRTLEAHSPAGNSTPVESKRRAKAEKSTKNATKQKEKNWSTSGHRHLKDKLFQYFLKQRHACSRTESSSGNN